MLYRLCGLSLGLLAGCPASSVTDVGLETGAPTDSPCAREVNVTDLGTVVLDAKGFGEPLRFEVPDCAHSFLLEVSGPDDVTFALDRLTDPSGALLIEGPLPSGQLASPMPMAPAEGVANAMVPNSNAAFVPGEYEAVVQGAQITGGLFDQQVEPFAGEVDVRLVYKGMDTLKAGGTLDITLYLTGAEGITAETAPTSGPLQDALVSLGETYGASGITIGGVSYVDIDERFQTITSLAGPDNDLADLFSQSAGSDGGLNFFIVSRFDVYGGLGAAIGGISGGIPGPALQPGSPRSGVAVALAGGRDTSGELDPDLISHVMAHEGGHYLGLFHTSELFGGSDPLPDTPEGADGDTNLMFPAVGGGVELSAQQSRVMHNHPEVAP